VRIDEALGRIASRRDLTRAETEDLFGQLMDGELEDVHKAALLIGLATKGESTGEIAGAAAAMRRRVVAIPHSQERAIDTCGTGGDGKGTFNISTAAALVAAAGGAPVAKHGNRSVSSRSGSADVLAALGVGLETSAEEAGRALDTIGIAFLFAPRLHPAMKEVMGVRRTLGVRTLFNLLGPLTNPAGARRQVLGVYARERVEDLALVLLELGSEHALVVHGADGLDEITTTGPTFAAEVRDGSVRSFAIDPRDFGVDLVAPDALEGGTPEENAAVMERLLEGRDHGALADVVALNAGAALYVAGAAPSLARGVGDAREILASGAAGRKLEALRAATRGAPEA
jgi:anthranilate phosphoribosyltransferase